MNKLSKKSSNKKEFILFKKADFTQVYVRHTRYQSHAQIRQAYHYIDFHYRMIDCLFLEVKGDLLLHYLCSKKAAL